MSPALASSSQHALLPILLQQNKCSWGCLNGRYSGEVVNKYKGQLFFFCDKDLMEKRGSLGLLDKEMCEYYSRNNYSKKDEVYCYEPNRKQISEFYSSMAHHFYQAKIKAPHNQPKPKALRLKSHYQSIKDPLKTCLPPSIAQSNSINTSGVKEVGVSSVPMFCQLQASKKQKYSIAEQIRELLGRDIKQMLEQKQEVMFRKHFPHRSQEKVRAQREMRTEELMREFNQLLVKYKNSRGSVATSLKLLEKENHNFMAGFESSGDQKFNILALFQKLYAETKSTDINKKLIDYLLKFHFHDHYHKRLNLNRPNQSNTSTPNLQEHAQHAPVLSLFNSQPSKQVKSRYLNEKSGVKRTVEKVKGRSQTCNKKWREVQKDKAE